MLRRIEYCPTAVAFVSWFSCLNIAEIGTCRPASGPADAGELGGAAGIACTPPAGRGLRRRARNSGRGRPADRRAGRRCSGCVQRQRGHDDRGGGADDQDGSVVQEHGNDLR